jgi:hypothetical protein
MKSQFVAAIAIAAIVVGAAWSLHFVKTGDFYCPQPSAASVEKLFAPCQAFDTALGHAVTREEAVRLGLLPNPEQPPLTPAQLVAEDHQMLAQEHATVGVAR